MSFFKLTPNQIKTNNARVRARATPEQLSVIQAVDAAFDQENAEFDRKMDAEARMRQQVADLLGRASPVSTSVVERFIEKSKQQPNGTMFYFESVPLVKTHGGFVDRPESYIHVLEKTVAGLTLNSPAVIVPYAKYGVYVDFTDSNKELTDASFFDLIKLALKRLFRRT